MAVSWIPENCPSSAPPAANSGPLPAAPVDPWTAELDAKF
ncbi:MAG: hypothetical protein K0S96_2281 [Geminicoccaceae bacterium]|jgi:hypothetical protein|nr:hypothetical protein [Geminicoccaceae bacterium]